MQETTVATKTCVNCSASFDITDKDLEFYDKISPVFQWEKFAIPSPSHCPDCRQQRRLAWRNERKLYRRKCDATGKDVISVYSDDKNIKAFDPQERFSDKRDPLDFGRDFSQNCPFQQQFQTLLTETPKPALLNFNGENSSYCENSDSEKNCYMQFVSYQNNSCYHGYMVSGSESCIDLYRTRMSQSCYECSKIKNCHNCFYCYDCHNCSFCFYSKNLTNCEYCLFSINLKNQKYMIFNKQVSKDEFSQFKAKLFRDPVFLEQQKHQYELLKKQCIEKSAHTIQIDTCSGDYLLSSQDCFDCFDVEASKNCKRCRDVYGLEDSYDNYCAGGDHATTYQTYETENWWFANYSMAGSCVQYSDHMLYCANCFHSSYCFGCVGLRNKSYCILNKQYTKEEYEVLVPQIIKKMQADDKWGEFFPITMSPFAYNETVAQEYFPLSKEEALAKWYERKDKEDKIYHGTAYTPLPIHEYHNEAQKIEVLNAILKCEVTGRPYKIIKQELEFYLKHQLPIPTKHPDQRHKERMTLRNPRKLRTRNCMKCSKDIMTSYAPERPETVYCEECYQKEVY